MTVDPARFGASPQVQPPLPFADTALEPVISARTLSFHYGKHHKGYFDALAKLVAGTPMADTSTTSGCSRTAFSTSKLEMFSPRRLIASFMRSTK